MNRTYANSLAGSDDCSFVRSGAASPWRPAPATCAGAEEPESIEGSRIRTNSPDAELFGLFGGTLRPLPRAGELCERRKTAEGNRPEDDSNGRKPEHYAG